MSVAWSIQVFLMLGAGLCGALPEKDARWEDAARADGVRRVGDALLSMTLEGGDAVEGRVGGSGEGEAALRRVAAGLCRFGAFRVDGCGVGRVTVRLDLEGLRDVRPQQWGRSAWAGFIESLGNGSIVVVGLAREAVGESEEARDTPLGWENTTSSGLAWAQRAARDEARQAMEKQLVRLGLPSFDGADFVRLAHWSEPTYAAGQVCVIRGELRILGELGGSGVAVPKVIRARGFGMAPLVHTRRPLCLGEMDIPPAWSDRRLVAMGLGADESPASAKRAARIDARVKLAREVDRLPLPEHMGGTVRAFILAHRDYADVWSAFLESVRLTGERSSGSETTVTVEIELDRLWNSIKERARCEDGRG